MNVRLLRTGLIGGIAECAFLIFFTVQLRTLPNETAVVLFLIQQISKYNLEYKANMVDWSLCLNLVTGYMFAFSFDQVWSRPLKFSKFKANAYTETYHKIAKKC